MTILDIQTVKSDCDQRLPEFDHYIYIPGNNTLHYKHFTGILKEATIMF